MDNLFSTHPAVENRVAQLSALAQQMGGSGGRTSLASDSADAGRGPRAQAIVDLGARPGLLSETTKMTSSGKQARRRSPTRDFQVGLPARRAAVELLDAVLDKKQPLGEVLSRSLDAGPMFDLPQRDRALARAIVATSLRRKGQLDIVIDRFLERGMPEKAGTLYPILLSGAAQLVFLKTPPHAVIDLAVTLAQYDPRARRYDKLVNAVLRRVAEHGEAIAGRARRDARQHARLALGALGARLGRGAHARHRRG